MSLLGIDLGTSGVKAGVFSLDGACIGQAYSEIDMLHPQPGWSELDSSRVWKTTCEVIAEAVAQAGSDPVTALSVGSFGEAVVPVSKHRNILDNSILCVDERGQEHIDRLLADFGHEAFYAINPNLLGPNYSMPKILWLKEHRPGVYEQADLFLHWADFIAFMLGADPATNNSHANRTLLFDLKKNDWSDELIAWSGIDRSKLAPVVSGGTVTGTVSDAMAVQLGLPKGVKVVAGGHDQCCNALGCGGISAGRAVYGMGSFDCITPVYRMPSDLQEMRRNHLNVEHHLVPGLFVSFHYNQAGLLVKWFRDTFTDGSVSYAQLDKEMPDEPTRLLVLPHFDTPPHHSPDTAGVIAGLRTSTQRGEILKAVKEGVALYFLEGMDALRGIGVGTAEFIASGGGARSDAGLQLRADILGVPIVRPAIIEAGVLGAAMNAGIATGIFRNPEEAVARFVKHERLFEPDEKRHAFYREKHILYRQLQPSLKTVFQRL
jgi:xylulokinase